MGQMKVCIEVLHLASWLNLKYLRRFTFLLVLPHFCFTWGRPWGNHAKCCMDGKRIRCLQIVSQHVPIYLQQFPSYSNHNCKKNRAICCMDGKTIQCLPNPSQHIYLSIFNSFRVIRCLSQCVSPKIANFTTFLFPLGTILGQSR